MNSAPVVLVPDFDYLEKNFGSFFFPCPALLFLFSFFSWSSVVQLDWVGLGLVWFGLVWFGSGRLLGE